MGVHLIMELLGACGFIFLLGWTFEKLINLIPTNIIAILITLFGLWLVALFVITIASFIHPDVLPAIANLFV